MLIRVVRRDQLVEYEVAEPVLGGDTGESAAKVSKRMDAPYRSGRGESWIKVKCVKRGTFTVVGYTPEGTSLVAALHLARKEGRKLSYVGKVGTGWSMAQSAKLRQRLEAIEVDRPLVAVPGRPKAVWVQPHQGGSRVSRHHDGGTATPRGVATGGPMLANERRLDYEASTTFFGGLLRISARSRVSVRSSSFACTLSFPTRTASITVRSSLESISAEAEPSDHAGFRTNRFMISTIWGPRA